MSNSYIVARTGPVQCAVIDDGDITRHWGHATGKLAFRDEPGLKAC